MSSGCGSSAPGRALDVLVLSQYFDPEPVPKPAELADYLSGRGHKVRVLTGYPNYPSGTLYPGFRLRPWARSRRGPVELWRAYEYPYHGRSTALRFANYATFMAAAVALGIWLRPPDVIYAWHPPLSVGLAAMALGLTKRAPFVYDVQDIWPEAAIASGFLREGGLARMLRRIERRVYRASACVLTPTEDARAHVVAVGAEASRARVLPHWIDVDAWGSPSAPTCQAMRAAQGWRADEFVLLFAGNLGAFQALEAPLEALAAFAPQERVRLVLVGDGSARVDLQRRAQALGLGARVQFLARREAAEMPALLGAADALLVHLKRSPIARLALPTKTLAYLASGRPLLVGAEGEAARVVEQAEAGLVARPEDPASLAQGLRRLRALTPEARARLGRNGRRWAAQHFARERILPRYEAVLLQVAGA